MVPRPFLHQTLEVVELSPFGDTVDNFKISSSTTIHLHLLILIFIYLFFIPLMPFVVQLTCDMAAQPNLFYSRTIPLLPSNCTMVK